eukprot:5573600-Amphidinium_carterae.1
MASLLCFTDGVIELYPQKDLVSGLQRHACALCTVAPCHHATGRQSTMEWLQRVLLMRSQGGSGQEPMWDLSHIADEAHRAVGLKGELGNRANASKNWLK